MSDSVAALQKATQNLVRASQRMAGFFVLSNTSQRSRCQNSPDEQKRMRLQILRMAGTLVETEFTIVWTN